MENPAPFVTASSWVLYDQNKGELMFGKCESQPRQVASLTKVMTGLVVFDIIDYMPHMTAVNLNSVVTILKPVANLQGTSALLLPGDNLTIE